MVKQERRQREDNRGDTDSKNVRSTMSSVVVVFVAWMDSS